MERDAVGRAVHAIVRLQPLLPGAHASVIAVLFSGRGAGRSSLFSTSAQNNAFGADSPANPFYPGSGNCGCDDGLRAGQPLRRRLREGVIGSPSPNGHGWPRTCHALSGCFCGSGGESGDALGMPRPSAALIVLSGPLASR